MVHQSQEGEANVCASEEIFSRKRQELLRLRDKNKEHELETQDYNKKICQRFAALHTVYTLSYTVSMQ